MPDTVRIREQLYTRVTEEFHPEAGVAWSPERGVHKMWLTSDLPTPQGWRNRVDLQSLSSEQQRSHERRLQEWSANRAAWERDPESASVAPMMREIVPIEGPGGDAARAYLAELTRFAAALA